MDTVKDAAHAIKQKLSHSTSATPGLILITGGTGFVATHVLNSFLRKGYSVRTTVRSQAKVDIVRKTLAKYAERLEFAIVDDFTAPGAFDEAVKGVHGVIHTASPFVLEVNDNKKDLLDPAIKGTTSLLESIVKNASDVKRVVITSSFAAVLDIKQGLRPGYTYSEKDWLPTTLEEAETADGVTAYCASKKLAEEAAHHFVKQQKPNFSLIALCPPMVYGPLAHSTDIDHLNTSAGDIWRFVDGSLAGQAPPPPNFPAFADVRDLAEAHVRAFELPHGNTRFLITSGNYDYSEVCTVLRKASLPVPLDNIPDPSLAEAVEYYGVDNTKSKKELGLEYTSLETCITDTGKSLLQIQEASKNGSEYDGTVWLD